MTVDFALRAPWYVRERGAFSLRDSRALRPEIQMYDGPNFVDRLLADPRDSLTFTDDDLWSYPVPVIPSITATGRERLATSRLITTNLRKLYQPSHDRFYAVVVEVFCDSPGLPRAGSHSDIEVRLVMRRQYTSVSGNRRPVRRLARNLLVELTKKQQPDGIPDDSASDLRDLWWADAAWRRRFEEDNAELFAEVTAHTDNQAWMVGAAGGQWRTVDTPPGLGRPPDSEQEFPMWRLPPRDDDCDAARTRSLWFGVIPTFSADHWTTPEGKVEQKLDDHAIYELQCFVRQKPPPGREHCPPKIYRSAPSEPFRLAAPMDPDGTKNRTVSLTLPDLRRLAARAGQQQGPGGVRIATPPNSQFVFNPFDGIPESGSGRIGAGGGICTFAFELFFIVAFFLFLLFLPIVVFVFQLWWMLALRFCIPPSASFDALADFFAEGGLIVNLSADAELEFDAQFGTDTKAYPVPLQIPVWPPQLIQATDPSSGDPIFADDPNFVNALILGTDPNDALKPEPPQLEPKPDDPLCPAP